MKTEVSRTSSQIGECDEALSALTENCDYPLPQVSTILRSGVDEERRSVPNSPQVRAVPV